MPIGYPASKGDISIIYNAEKSKRILGMKYIGMEDMIRDTVEYFEERKLFESQKD